VLVVWQVGRGDRRAWVGGLCEGADRVGGLFRCSLSMDQAGFRYGNGQPMAVHYHLAHGCGAAKWMREGATQWPHRAGDEWEQGWIEERKVRCLTGGSCGLAGSWVNGRRMTWVRYAGVSLEIKHSI
jgi:hypothetical protein